MDEVSKEDLAAFETLVRIGLADIVGVEKGEPMYRFGSRFVTTSATFPDITLEETRVDLP
jgi:hypothetical protein